MTSVFNPSRSEQVGEEERLSGAFTSQPVTYETVTEGRFPRVEE